MKAAVSLFRKVLGISFGILLILAGLFLIVNFADFIMRNSDITSNSVTPGELGIGIFFIVIGIFWLPFSVSGKLSKWVGLSPYLVLLSGSFWVAWILFKPPLYVIRGGEKLLYEEDTGHWLERYYPTPDYITAILQSMGVAVIFGTMFYLLKKMVSASTEKK